MKIHINLLIAVIAILSSGSLLAQRPPVDYGTRPQLAQSDTTQAEAELITPWKNAVEIGHYSVTNDSLLRWEIWPNWGDFFAYRHDVVPYRQGTIGRLDAFELDGYAPSEQFVSLNGVSLNNPLTGFVNYNHIPANRVGFMTETKGSVYSTNIRSRDFYLVEPLSYLNFDEAAYGYRNLEFMVAQNFKERTNAEISFWDRRDGGNFRENDVQGSQILFKGYHYLNQNLQLRGLIIRNEFNREEPFGYVVPDSQVFAFDEFATQPNVSNRESDHLRRDTKIGLYSRIDSLSEESWGIELDQSKNDFRLPYSADTLNWDIRMQAISGFINRNAGNLSFRSDLSFNRFKAKENRNFSKSGWEIAQLGFDASLNITDQLSIYSRNQFDYRTDDNTGYISDFGFQFNNSKSSFNLNIGLFSKIPTIQQMYWRSDAFNGNSNLENSTGVSVSGDLNTHFGDYFKVGLSGRYLVIDNDVFIGTDSLFVNSTSYPIISGTVFGTFENNRFQFESSATAHAITAEEPTNVLDLNNKPDRKLWFRNNAFVKGYVFDRAAFIKLGIRTTLSPIPYRSRLFNTELQYWETAALDEADIPAFFRMDTELSARVRSMMVLIRWENLLDGYGQAGYFEAATLPMPGRRLIVGIRAQFRN